jgi:hypothetical protein
MFKIFLLVYPIVMLLCTIFIIMRFKGWMDGFDMNSDICIKYLI